MARERGLAVNLRKPLLFTAVFGVGLTVLWFAREDPSEQAGRSPQPVELPRQVPSGNSAEAAVSFGGRLEYTQFAAQEREGRRPKLFRLIAADVEAVQGDVYDVEGLFVELFEPDTQAVRATLRSPRSRMPIRLRAGRQEFGEEDEVTLTAVDAEVFDGLPLVPARFEASALTVSLGDALYTTPERVTLRSPDRGPGALATGSEFTLDQRAGLIRFGRNGEITFSLEEGAPTSLKATGAGALSIERVSDDGTVRVLVEGGARLETSQGGGAMLSAQRVELVGAPGSSGAILARSASASGDVVVDGWGGRFGGARARLEFDERGQLNETHLEGEPSARVPLAVEGGEAVEVTLEATDSVRLLADAGFSVSGPCTVRVQDRDFVLECDGALLGTGREQGGFGWLSASGGVRARLGQTDYQGEDLELRSFASSDGEAEWTARARDGAVLTGALEGPEGPAYRAEVGGALELATRGDELFIRRAEDVDLSVEGPEALQLYAGSLEEASLAARTFQAGGGVRYSDGQLRAEAAEAFAEAGGLSTLRGDEVTPVRVELAASGPLQGGEVIAHLVRFGPGNLIADGDVSAEFQQSSGTLSLEAALLEASFQASADGAPVEGPVLMSLRGVERCRLVSPGETTSWSAELTSLSLIARTPGGGEGASLELRGALAAGAVLLERQTKRASFAASGERLELGEDGSASLTGSDEGFVRVSGSSSDGESLGRVIAREVRLSDQRMSAVGATLTYQGAGEGEVLIKAVSAERMELSLGRASLAGAVRVEGETRGEGAWTLRSSQALLEGGSVTAWDGFEWRGEDDMRATGDALQADAERVELSGAPAKLRLAGLEWEANELRFDRERMLLEAGRGRVRSVNEDPIELTYEEIRPIEGQDTSILALHRPRFTRGETEARAEWALLWVDQSGEREAPRSDGEGPNLFGQVDAQGLSTALDEVYIEGRVEVMEAGVRRAEIDAVYLDLVEGRGWLKGARLTLPAEVGGEETTLAVDAEWLRHTADGSLTANSARLTTCDHVDPHYFIRTKDLRLKPSDEEGVHWDISIRSNDLVFEGGISLPLPAIEYEADKAGNPLIDRLILGDTARFGTFLEATVDGELGIIERAASFITRTSAEDISGGVQYRGSWLGERGLMLGLGANIEAEDRFWFRLYADGLDDGSRDKGTIRVNPSDRPDFRSWVRARGRAELGEHEWIDIAFSQQSDAGVQAEFFEREFLRYEERENYLHWRKVQDEDFTAAQVKLRAGDFRNEVEELPSLAYSHGLTPLFDVGERAALYQASVDFGSYRRREGSGGTISPFDPFFDDALGTRRLVRFDTRHRLELPIRLAGGGVTAVPFMQLAGTRWSEGVDPLDSPHRGALSAGLALSTTLWKRTASGGVHTIAPFISLSGDVWAEAGDGDPIPLDAIEDPLPGDHLDLGVHSRWSDPATGEAIDLSVFGRYAQDTETVLPLEVLTEYLGRAGDVAFALQHDGRYDLEAGETLYSRSAIGFEPMEGLSWELGFHQGKDAVGAQLFEAASVGSRWRVSPKWELEARQTISLIDSDELASRLVLRRFTHDLILDLELSERLGEGGSSVSFSLSPVVGWSRDRLGVLDHWLAPRR